MTKQTIDYDAFRREVEQEPIGFKIGGVTYDMAPSLPAAIAIQVLALQESKDSNDDVPLDLLQSVGASCFGADVWVELLTVNNVTIEEIPDLVQAMLSAYAPQDEDDDEDPQPAST